MFRKVLVPLDGSHEAQRALPVAACIARSLRSEIRVADVLPSGADEDTIKCAFIYLNRIAPQVALTGVRVGTQVRTGSTADGVLSVVELLPGSNVSSYRATQRAAKHRHLLWRLNWPIEQGLS
jgi:nucleotide-binding universal stress UspA family protein